MTEQPEIIESVEEALEAEKQGRLQFNWPLSHSDIAVIIAESTVEYVTDLITQGLLSWKPEEWEYVTVESFRLRDFIDGEYQIQTGNGEWHKTNEYAFDWGRLEFFIDNNRLRRKKVEGGGEIELVEWKHAQHGYALYIPKGQSPRSDPFCQTGRTVKGVIHEE